jgi:hypothetical protein
VDIPLTIPNASGKCTLKASARASGKSDSTLSRRWVKIED